MGRGLRVGGIVLGALALLWSVLLLGIFTLFAVGGGQTTILLPPLVGFGAGALSIMGGLLGTTRIKIGATLVLTAGVAGVLAPAAPLLFNPRVETTTVDILVAYVATSWWAVLMVLVGGITLYLEKKAA